MPCQPKEDSATTGIVRIVVAGAILVGLNTIGTAYAQQAPRVRTVPFLTDEQAAAKRSVPVLVHDPSNPTAPAKVAFVAPDDLGDALTDFVRRMGQAFPKVPAAVGQYSVDEIELSMTFTTEANGLVISVGEGAGIAVTFKRDKSGTLSPSPKAK